MKSLGTITACFPYVDEDTRNILQSVMDEAKDYNDFAERVCEKALKETVPTLMIYFAYFHVYIQNKYNLLRRLIEAQVGSDLTQPITLMYGVRRGDSIEWDDFQKAIAAAIKATTNDWIACHIFVAWRELGDAWFSESHSESKTLDILESKIMHDGEFSFFISSLHRIKANRLCEEGNIEDARKWYDHAISIARKHDNQEQLAILLFQKADMVKKVNFSEALSIMKVQGEICEELGYLAGKALHKRLLGLIAMAKGQYEAAIDYGTNYLKWQESHGLPLGFSKSVIAYSYNQKGDAKHALELILDCMDDLISVGYPFALIQEAWALLNLGRNEEASNKLDKARELSLKSGGETKLGLVYFVEGLIALHRREFKNSSFALEKALDIFERYNSTSSINMALLRLADVEVETFPYDSGQVKSNFSGPWMKKVITHAEKRDLPGIAAQATLLQSRFLFKKGQVAQSRKLLKQVLKISEKSGMTYLKEMAEVMLPDLLIS